MNNFEDIQNTLGYYFKNKNLLKTALTHPSFDGCDNYERLEFLGDAVIELSISNILFYKYPNEKEGALTKKRSALVCRESLSEIAADLNLDKYIILGKGEEETGGRKKASILENVFEAVIGAVFADSDYDTADKVIKNIFLSKFDFAEKIVVDYKTSLQEYLQKKGSRNIEYSISDKKGPAHDTTFYVSLKVDGIHISDGVGKSKKEAEQNAAQSAYNKFLNS